MTEPQTVEQKVAQAGELLIRAAAVLGTLPADTQRALCDQTHGKLIDCLGWAIEGAAQISAQTRDSLKATPPRGFVAIITTL
ncbi:TPA: hypothetical protein VDU83_006742 [Pseudomonas aeruginosa]|nr:hypothetical protein [Pseudomonas aeruginosa]